MFKQLTLALLSLVLSIVLSACGSENKSKEVTTTESPFGRNETFEAPRWSGAYNVASTIFAWQDHSREEPHTENSNDFREVQVRLLYPTDQAYSQNKLPVLPDEFWQRVGSDEIITGKKLRPSNYDGVKWDIELDAPISDMKQSYPLIIFSNGYGLTPENHVRISAELASRGYIVASINHPYGSGISHLLDGQTVYATRLPDDNLGVDLKLWSDDQLFVLDKMANLNVTTNSVIFGRLDHRIGVMGHSYGGAAAYYSAWQDTRIQAVVNLDGTIFNSENKNIEQPFMYMQNDNGYDHDIFAQVNNDGYAIVFQNQIKHHSFADYVLFWAWDFPNLKPFGPMDSIDAFNLITDLAEQFFNKYFDEANAPLLDEQSVLTEKIKVIRF